MQFCRVRVCPAHPGDAPWGSERGHLVSLHEKEKEGVANVSCHENKTKKNMVIDRISWRSYFFSLYYVRVHLGSRAYGGNIPFFHTVPTLS